MKKTSRLLFILLLSIAMGHSAFSGDNNWGSQVSDQERMPEKIRHQVQKLITNGEKVENSTGLLITYPYDGAVFPPEIAAPVITWDDTNTASKQWLVMVEFSSQHTPIYAFADKHYWEPDKPTWEIIKANSVRGSAKIIVYGFDNKRACNITAKNRIRISTSKDPVDASIFYRQVQLPFKVGKKNFYLKVFSNLFKKRHVIGSRFKKLRGKKNYSGGIKFICRINQFF